jgi:beta-phosphoglucomutase-like phosphatase (HAD superfamily)
MLIFLASKPNAIDRGEPPVATEVRTARLTILVDPRKKAVFERLCAEEDATPSQVVRRLIRAYIESRTGKPWHSGPSPRSEARAVKSCPNDRLTTSASALRHTCRRRHPCDRLCKLEQRDPGAAAGTCAPSAAIGAAMDISRGLMTVVNRQAPYRAIIFDFNGVLLWDAALHVESWKAVAHSLRGYALTDAECAVHMHGRTAAYVLSYLGGRQIVGQELFDWIARKESHYRRLCLENPQTFRLSPGAEPLLDDLVRKNIPRTIATSSEKTNLDFFIEHLGLERWFDLSMVAYDDGSAPGKPAPDIYLKAAKNLGVPPSSCVVVEDAVSGIQAAHAAGIGHVIGMASVASQEALLAIPGVSTAIESLAAFPRELVFDEAGPA